MSRPIEDALRALLKASGNRAVVSAVQHFTRPPVKGAFLSARKAAKTVLSEFDELGHLRDLAVAGMSSISRVGKLSKRDAERLSALESKYGVAR